MNYGYNTPSYVNPYGRANYGMTNYQQPQYPITQPQQPIMQDLPIQYVGYANLKEVEAHILMPNSKAIFIDKPNNMYYEKTCNNEGQSFIKKFKQVDTQGEERGVETNKDTHSIDLSSYVKKDELGAFVSLKQYNELLSKVEILQKQLGGRQNNGTKGWK